MRVLGVATLVVLMIATACSGDLGAESNTTATTTPDDAIEPGAEGSDTTSPGEPETTQTGSSVLDVCSLVTESQLATAFPDAVPSPEPATGQQGEASCRWGPTDEANLVVTVWPGEEFYSSCDACEPAEYGQESWIDFSTFLAYAMVRLDGATLTVNATSIGMEESDFLALVETAAAGAQ